MQPYFWLILSLFFHCHCTKRNDLAIVVVYLNISIQDRMKSTVSKETPHAARAVAVQDGGLPADLLRDRSKDDSLTLLVTDRRGCRRMCLKIRAPGLLLPASSFSTLIRSLFCYRFGEICPLMIRPLYWVL
jgi:hypothetical protein